MRRSATFVTFRQNDHQSSSDASSPFDSVPQFSPMHRGKTCNSDSASNCPSVPKALPSAIQHQVQALGTRMRTAGKEETVLDAQFVDDVGNKKSIHVVHQISGLVRIEGVHDKTAVTFDGEFTHGVADRTDESLLDTFVWIRPRGCFIPCERAHQCVLLGHDFQADFQAAPGFKGPRYDIYVVTAPDRIRRAGTLRTRDAFTSIPRQGYLQVLDTRTQQG